MSIGAMALRRKDAKQYRRSFLLLCGLALLRLGVWIFFFARRGYKIEFAVVFPGGDGLGKRPGRRGELAGHRRKMNVISDATHYNVAAYSKWEYGGTPR
jgi:hypothetical protein